MSDLARPTPHDIHFPDGRVASRSYRRMLQVDDTFTDSQGRWVVVRVEPGEEAWQVWVEEADEEPDAAA